MKITTLLIAAFISIQLFGQEKFPDGTPIPDWFKKNDIINIKNIEHKYNITDYGVTDDSTLLQTDKIQATIDLAAKNGGGLVIIPKGTYLSGALFFKPETHLYLEEGAVLKGSDDISNFPIKLTRIEGQTLKYFSALINADGLHGFTISGKGTINGNGLRYWKSFWLRRTVNPKCTNMDELRPRLLYISNCNDVQISGVHLKNSPFWTTHLYKCNRVKLLNLHITSPAKPVKAPSTDGVDIDACSNVLIKNCYISVNDDAVALKGGKGPWADKDNTNGSNQNIIIEDCTYGFCHSALTFGSESIHDRNIILRRCTVKDANRLLWLKMRPDTPQRYEYILVEDITGNAQSFLYIKPWKQFFDLQGRKDTPISYLDNLTMRNINFECNVFFNVNKSEQYVLTHFNFENLTIKAEKGEYDKNLVHPFILKNVKVTQ
ncbi:glycosyl hydrolase family 28 protein [uncultured Bacteroides sp.]|uniref:rhamnogalacturonidase n=1 Tax=uncultured Bacteroides sp. TaxID=162156 RepID=UPI002AAAAEC7|nr:glycosyl hydrolase family 28 protein [uncultured Bacteroides sp.]